MEPMLGDPIDSLGTVPDRIDIIGTLVEIVVAQFEDVRLDEPQGVRDAAWAVVDEMLNLGATYVSLGTDWTVCATIANHIWPDSPLGVTYLYAYRPETKPHSRGG